MFLCSLGLPNHLIFSLQGVFCERVLRPRFENDPIFKLHLHTEKLVIRAQLSKHLPRASSCGLALETGSEQGWDGWTGGSLLQILPCGRDVSAGGASSFALQCVWFLALALG